MIDYVGTVQKGPFAAGSKSEHDAIFLNANNKQYVLRRANGNPFHDPDLEKLVGKTLQVTGVISGYTLIFSEWREVKPAPKRAKR